MNIESFNFTSSFSLFGKVDFKKMQSPTYAKMLDIARYYTPETDKKDDNSRSKEKAIDDLLYAMLDTKIMKDTREFLQKNGLFFKFLPPYKCQILGFSQVSKRQKMKTDSRITWRRFGSLHTAEECMIPPVALSMSSFMIWFDK